MSPIIKFGTILGMLLLVVALYLTHDRYAFANSAILIQVIFLFFPALLIYGGIRAFLQMDPPRPAYYYWKGVRIGLGIVAIGAILSAVLFAIWTLLDRNQDTNFSDVVSQALHVVPNGVLMALLVPLLFFGKNEQTVNPDNEILDNEL